MDNTLINKKLYKKKTERIRKLTSTVVAVRVIGRIVFDRFNIVNNFTIKLI
jgi:hypothetical protein